MFVHAKLMQKCGDVKLVPSINLPFVNGVLCDVLCGSVDHLIEECGSAPPSLSPSHPFNAVMVLSPSVLKRKQ